MKKIIFILLGAAFVFLAVKKIFFKPAYMYVGTLEATRIDVPARLATVIQESAIEEGQEVTPKQILFKLDCSDLKIAQRQIKKNYTRTNTLSQSGVLPAESYENSKREQDESDLRLSWCNVEAPIGGTVMNRYFEAGEWVQPGSKLATLADISDIWAYVYVAQPDIAALHIGQAVKGSLPEMPGKAFTGKIIKINEEAEFTPKNVQTRDERSRLVFGVKIRFDNQEKILKPGMSIEVALSQPQHR